jgi:type I restriction enzyme, R subunit
VIDYFGVLKQLGEAMELYGSFDEFDKEDIEGALIDINAEAAKLPQKHSELWDIFKTISNKRDEEAYERLLSDEERREKFYEKFSAYNRVLSIALSATKFNQETPEKDIKTYKEDLGFFQKLRVSVKKRYSESIDYREYESKVQRLIDTHVKSDEILQIVEPVNIFDQDKFQEEIEKLETTAAKADTIASRTKKTISEKMEEDPYFYRRFSKILEEAIQAFRNERITDAEYLNRVNEVMNAVVNRSDDNFPETLKHKDAAKAFYGVVNEVLTRLKVDEPRTKEISASTALEIDDIIERNKVVDWLNNSDAKNTIRNEIDDFLYELKEKESLDLDLDSMDLIVETSLDIAKKRYA